MKIKPGLEKSYKKFKETNRHDKYSLTVIKVVEKIVKEEDPTELLEKSDDFQRREVWNIINRFFN